MPNILYLAQVCGKVEEVDTWKDASTIQNGSMPGICLGGGGAFT